MVKPAARKQRIKKMLRSRFLKYLRDCRVIGEDDNDPIFEMIQKVITNVALLWSESGAELVVTMQDCLRIILIAGKPKERLVQPGLPPRPTSCYLWVNDVAPLNFDTLFEENVLELTKQYLYCVIFHMIDFMYRETGFYEIHTHDEPENMLDVVKREKRCACENLTPRI